MDIWDKQSMEQPFSSINWAKLEELNQSLNMDHCPKVTIVIPTFNDAKKIGISLESLLIQDYPDFEILIIDAASRDRTLEIVKSFRDTRIRLSSVSDYNRYEMMNKGIFIAKGTYINFLYPGDYYLNRDTLKIMMQSAKKRISLVYCGCVIREADKEVTTLFREFSLDLLKSGRQPSSLQSCWFHKNVFHEVGKFDSHYILRGGFDFFCRFLLYERLDHAGVKRVLTDYDLRDVTRKMLTRHFVETARILYKNFGFFTLIKWLFHQNDTKRYLRYSFRSLKKALVGR